MILIKNTQRLVPVDKINIQQTVQKILHILGYTDFDIGIWFTTNQTIRKYNQQYRHKDTPTDVLSFPYYPELQAGKKIIAKIPDEKNLGDLIISPAYVQKDAREQNISFEKRMNIILVHGVCHLLGYDHINDADYKIMRAKEQKILDLIIL